MQSTTFSRGGLSNSQHSLELASVNRCRVRGRVQPAFVVSLVCLAWLAIGTGSSVLAQDPVPTIVGFQVTWTEADPLNNTFKFTFTGTATNCQNLINPAVELFGYPFDATVAPDSTGAFSVDFTLDGDVAFGRTIVAKITVGGTAASEQVFTST